MGTQVKEINGQGAVAAASATECWPKRHGKGDIQGRDCLRVPSLDLEPRVHRNPRCPRRTELPPEALSAAAPTPLPHLQALQHRPEPSRNWRRATQSHLPLGGRGKKGPDPHSLLQSTASNFTESRFREGPSFYPGLRRGPQASKGQGARPGVGRRPHLSAGRPSANFLAALCPARLSLFQTRRAPCCRARQTPAAVGPTPPLEPLPRTAPRPLNSTGRAGACGGCSPPPPRPPCAPGARQVGSKQGPARGKGGSLALPGKPTAERGAAQSPESLTFGRSAQPAGGARLCRRYLGEEAAADTQASRPGWETAVAVAAAALRTGTGGPRGQAKPGCSLSAKDAGPSAARSLYRRAGRGRASVRLRAAATPLGPRGTFVHLRRLAWPAGLAAARTKLKTFLHPGTLLLPTRLYHPHPRTHPQAEKKSIPRETMGSSHLRQGVLAARVACSTSTPSAFVPPSLQAAKKFSDPGCLSRTIAARQGGQKPSASKGTSPLTSVHSPRLGGRTESSEERGGYVFKRVQVSGNSLGRRNACLGGSGLNWLPSSILNTRFGAIEWVQEILGGIEKL
ncbi:hypothetical protein AAY473_023810 [Plecturocebus cupreus]